MNYRNNGTAPRPKDTGAKVDRNESDNDENTQRDVLDTDSQATIPIENPDEDGQDVIDRIRAKRKRQEALKSLPESKRMKVNIPEDTPGTVLIVLTNTGIIRSVTNKFYVK